MAIVPQTLYVIRDTLKNQIMKGAKGQLAFETVGVARRSLTHTQWWRQAQQDGTLRKLMPNGNIIVDAREQAREVRSKQRWDNRDLQLEAEYHRIEDEIKTFTRGNDEYRKNVSAYKFDKQSRYAVELLVNLETREIT